MKKLQKLNSLLFARAKSALGLSAPLNSQSIFVSLSLN